MRRVGFLGFTLLAAVAVGGVAAWTWSDHSRSEADAGVVVVDSPPASSPGPSAGSFRSTFAAAAPAGSDQRPVSPLANDGPPVDSLASDVLAVPVLTRNEVTGIRVFPRGGASTFADMGLSAGDVVTSVDYAPVEDAKALARLQEKYPEGATVPLTVLREGRQSDLLVRLRARR